MLGVDVQPLGLAIGAVIALIRQPGDAPGPSSQVDAEPAQVFDELGFEAGFGALQVGIFNAQDECAAGASGEEPVIERGACIAYVEQAGGRRGKPYAGKIRSCHQLMIDGIRSSQWYTHPVWAKGLGSLWGV